MLNKLPPRQLEARPEPTWLDKPDPHSIEAEQADSSLELNNLERLDFYALGQGVANFMVTRYVYKSSAPSLFNNKFRKKCVDSQKFLPTGVDVYTRSRHPITTREVAYYKTHTTPKSASAMPTPPVRRMCILSAQGQSTNAGQETALAGPSYPTLP